MATHTDSSPTRKKNNGFTYSILLLVGVCIASAGLVAWDFAQGKRLSGFEEDLTKLTSELQTLQEDDEVQLYTKLQANMGMIEQYKKLSKIDTFILALNTLSRTYDIALTGMSYSAGSLHTSAVAKNDNMDFLTSQTNRYKLASQKIARMLDEVRKDPKQIFSLGFIENFSGQDSIEFSVTLELK